MGEHRARAVCGRGPNINAPGFSMGLGRGRGLNIQTGGGSSRCSTGSNWGNTMPTNFGNFGGYAQANCGGGFAQDCPPPCPPLSPMCPRQQQQMQGGCPVSNGSGAPDCQEQQQTDCSPFGNNGNFTAMQGGWDNNNGGNWGGQKTGGGSGISVNVTINGRPVCQQEC